MVEKDLDKRIEEIVGRAKQARKQELADARAMERESEAQRMSKVEAKENKTRKERKFYTAVIITKLEYEGVNIPSREQLAEDIGSTIMKWAAAPGRAEDVWARIWIDQDTKREMWN